MRILHFAKLEGSGNDFVVIEESLNDEPVYPGMARQICDRHRGIGADGLILYARLSCAEADFGMRLFNADGSEAEISGNGLRCLAAHIFQERLNAAAQLLVQTQAGIKRIRRIDSNGALFSFEVEMGKPILDATRIPFRLDPPPKGLVGCELQVGEELYSVTVTSMGNPHCSIFLDDFESLDWKRVGSEIEVHPAFPERTNVEFIKVSNPACIEVRFWERGVGATLSSGTGACAAMVASVLNGYASRRVRITTQGGNLEIEWRADGLLQMTGPAKVICKGDYFFDDAG